jgi:hypothetical protein
MIDFTCPDCGKRSAFPNGEAGQITKCAGCNGYVKVPPLGCELPIARALHREFFIGQAFLGVMILAWAMLFVFSSFLNDPLSSPPAHVPTGVLLLLALVFTLGTVFVTIMLPWHRRSLPALFLQLGRLTGKSQREIVVAAGEPSAWTDWDEETELLEWRSKQYYVALVFRGEVCQGVQQEARVDVRQAL